jgi:hypothetical protein
MDEVKTYNGRKIKLPGQSYAEYVAWRDAMLREIGKELASNLPMFYGNVEFNIQNSKFVNWNMKLSGK